ncbi:unnamed protein product [Tuber melanosporum]|jgi:FK506-binding protein 2|uniref:peptidylprolyl isomerase n=1 Tax=Tuber melanosporum (strain Mel28) TaxID=656061 RepID=D5GCW0_TUBMM|nr:uncharacterized protein GSTUM_00000766001 [Tuber melanosporum]CAZ82353.1 unnamed protein product [Tuber melanosporum]
MRVASPFGFALCALVATAFAQDVVEIVKQKQIECERKTVKGDTINVHYRGTLKETGDQFDASYDRGQPFTFTLGENRVIQGWERGLLDMCIGEKRKLIIPFSLAYGAGGMPPVIPAKSDLVFETELLGIQGFNPEKQEL